MKVDIYITTIFRGNFAEGSGAYGIVLQVKNGNEPVTKEHYVGWSGISCQRLNARAAAEALNYMTAPCDVVIHTDSQYIQYVAGCGERAGKHRDVWESFFNAGKRMKSVSVVAEGEHEYSNYLKCRLKQGTYKTVKDK